MKRSQINYAIDKANAIAETFRGCRPEFAFLPPMPGESSRWGSGAKCWVVMLHSWFRLQNIVEGYHFAKSLDQKI
ncbi:MAG: hypothetical protein H6R25_1578 [Proteobacteria bacterium]|nr:hypothetical protein [Pseudomonadota bacterium]